MVSVGDKAELEVFEPSWMRIFCAEYNGENLTTEPINAPHVASIPPRF